MRARRARVRGGERAASQRVVRVRGGERRRGRKQRVAARRLGGERVGARAVGHRLARAEAARARTIDGPRARTDTAPYRRPSRAPRVETRRRRARGTRRRELVSRGSEIAPRAPPSVARFASRTNASNIGTSRRDERPSAVRATRVTRFVARSVLRTFSAAVTTPYSVYDSSSLDSRFSRMPVGCEKVARRKRAAKTFPLVTVDAREARGVFRRTGV